MGRSERPYKGSVVVRPIPVSWKFLVLPNQSAYDAVAFVRPLAPCLDPKTRFMPIPAKRRSCRH
jgi:hypothetical protein